jgi:hypothetical protein
MFFSMTRRVAAAATDSRRGAVVRNLRLDGLVPSEALVSIATAPKAIGPIDRDGTSQSSHRPHDMPCHVRRLACLRHRYHRPASDQTQPHLAS